MLKVLNNRVRCFALMLVTALVASDVLAHAQKAAITTVLFNPRTENIEVMHRFNMHDAEHAVGHIFGKGADIISSEDTQQQFADYVQTHFAMYNADEKEIPLSSVGYEVEGKHFWVYQETSEPAKLEKITIQHNALREIWPDQTNTINVEGKGNLRTLTFTENVELLSVEFK